MSHNPTDGTETLRIQDKATISIIVPTRGRPEGLRTLLQSLKATTERLDALEVVLVIDDDDEETLDFSFAGVTLKRVIVEPGLNMGALNTAGYEACIGDYIMLLNDDVTARTQGWDDIVLSTFRSFPDEIVLVHTDDGIFRKSLCTFPFVTRTFCEMVGGICPSGYIRYRIDDHIYHIFNLLAVLGKRRIVYVPEVLFEHANWTLNDHGDIVYTPDEEIQTVDAKLFDDLSAERKECALTLMEHIDKHFNSKVRENRVRKLEEVADFVELRRPEYVRDSQISTQLLSCNTRVTVAVFSEDIESSHARHCLDSLKKHTLNFDLVILDNNKSSEFSHSREMNRIISMTESEYLILMEDDVFVDEGWLDGLLKCLAPPVGVVTPCHHNEKGAFSYSGVVMKPDFSGNHGLDLSIPDRPVRTATIPGGAFLIDMSKCGHLRFDERYSKYFLGIDYGLQVWEAGYEVVCSPHTTVTHLGGGTSAERSAEAQRLFEDQRKRFVSTWIQTGRYQSLEREVWTSIPDIHQILQVPDKLTELMKSAAGDERKPFEQLIDDVFGILEHRPILLDYAKEHISKELGGTDDQKTKLRTKEVLDRCQMLEVLQTARLDGPRISIAPSTYGNFSSPNMRLITSSVRPRMIYWGLVALRKLMGSERYERFKQSFFWNQATRGPLPMHSEAWFLISELLKHIVRPHYDPLQNVTDARTDGTPVGRRADEVKDSACPNAEDYRREKPGTSKRTLKPGGRPRG